jgi:multisubunit Na+/H+ antiporter MnhB subunit
MLDGPKPLLSGPERDEAAGYRPVSALAVAALIVAGLTTFAVLLTWSMAWFIRKRPILVWQLLLVGAVGLVLALLAIRAVRRSEGTRTGSRLALAAMWLSIFCLGGYGAYYFAIDTAVRQQAELAAQQFFDHLKKSEPELAFRMTRDPGQQRGIESDAKKIRDRFGAGDLHQFMQTDLVRILRTWPDKSTITYVGAGERSDYPEGFVVELDYSLRTPEGQFDVDAWTRGVDDVTTGGRDWQIIFPRTAVKSNFRLTRFGRICMELQKYWALVGYSEWAQKLPSAPAAEIGKILRVEGNVPVETDREKLIMEVKKPRAIIQNPGAGPSRPAGLPTIYFDANGVRIVQLVQVAGPAEGSCPAILSIQVIGDELVKELQRLAGPGWEGQPFLSDDTIPTLLADYKYELKVTELNLRPSLPRIASTPSRP